MIEEIFSFESEQSAIGLILSNEKYLDGVRDKLEVSDFYNSYYQGIFSLCCDLQDEGKKFGPVQLKPILQSQWSEDPSEVLVSTIAAMYSPISLGAYCDTIKDLSNRRKLSKAAGVLSQETHNLDVSLEDITGSLESVLDSVANKDDEWKTVVLADVVDDVFRVLESVDDVNYIPTGIKPLDDIIAGLFPSFFYVFAARPGMAKTTVALNIAYNVAKLGHPVVVFNLEMANTESVPRILCNAVFEEREIQYESFARKDLTELEMKTVQAARSDLYKIPLLMRDEPYMNIDKLRRECRKIKRKVPGLKVIIVDYLQLFTGGYRYKGNRVQEVTEISRGMKNIAKELNVAVIALSQLSRDIEKRENPRPLLSDLRESGSIEQDADLVVFNHYEYNALLKKEPKSDADHLQWSSDLASSQDKIELIVAKRRGGRTGSAYCRYVAAAAAVR